MSGALGNLQVPGRNAAFSSGDNIKQNKLSFRNSQVRKLFLASELLSTFCLHRGVQMHIAPTYNRFVADFALSSTTKDPDTVLAKYLVANGRAYRHCLHRRSLARL